MKSVINNNQLTFKLKRSLGFSLIEMLIVVGVFSILAIMITQTLASSLRTSKKSDNLGRVKENVEYVMNYMERTLRTAKKLDLEDDPAVPGVDICTPTDTTNLRFINSDNNPERFYWDSATAQIRYYDSSGSLRPITSNQIRIVAGTSFTCVPGSGGEPDSVIVTITAQDSLTATSAESAKYSATTTISLRNYSRN